MSWLSLSLVSALLLGVYEVLKKLGVRDNAVLPVLFWGVVTGSCVWTPLLLLQRIAGVDAMPEALVVTPLPVGAHLMLFGKSALVGTSWILGYFALRNLPLSIAAPIRATGPLWTILLAVLLFGESPAAVQWLGVIVILTSFFAFSLAGKLEGIHFHRDKWVGWMILSTLFSASSALYDKYLLQTQMLTPPTVQAWFTIYMVLFLLPFYLLWHAKVWPRQDFEWRWSIPFIGLTLLLADFAYFSAISMPDAMIALISPLRRASLLVSFAAGAVLFGEKNIRAKAVCVVGILVGVILLYAGG